MLIGKKNEKPYGKKRGPRMITICRLGCTLAVKRLTLGLMN